MTAKKYPDIKVGNKPFKRLLCSIVMTVLGRGFQSVAGSSHYVAKEVETWPEGFIWKMEILPSGPYMVMKKEKGKLKYLGSKDMNSDLAIVFKNVDAAFAMFTVQMNTYEAWVQGRLLVRGDLAIAQSITRALNIVEHYLFTWPIARLILKRKPPMMPYHRFMAARLRAYLVGITLGI